jgi:hypothetical protein
MRPASICSDLFWEVKPEPFEVAVGAAKGAEADARIGLAAAVRWIS